MARQYWITDFGDRSRAKQVIRICERAIEVDPDYAQAWALMALAQAHLFYGFSANENLDSGAAAAERALALDPNIAEARLPQAWSLAEQGRHEEANAEVATALQLSGESWEVNKEAARIFYRQRRLEDAARHLKRATELMKADFHGWGMLFASYIAQGNFDGAKHCAQEIIEQVEKVLAHDSKNGVALCFGALSFATLGRVGDARQWIERALLLDPDNLFMRYNMAWGQIAIFNDKEAAIEMVRSVLEKAGPSTIRLAANDPNLDRLRDDSRFQNMLVEAKKRTGLDDAPSVSATPPVS